MNVSLFGFLVLLATLVEGIVEYFIAPLFDVYLPRYKFLLMYVAVLLAVAFTLFYRLDMIAALAGLFNVEIANTVFGQIVTGVVLGRGSNYLHQIITKYTMSQG